MKRKREADREDASALLARRLKLKYDRELEYRRKLEARSLALAQELHIADTMHASVTDEELAKQMQAQEDRMARTPTADVHTVDDAEVARALQAELDRAGAGGKTDDLPPCTVPPRTPTRNELDICGRCIPLPTFAQKRASRIVHLESYEQSRNVCGHFCVFNTVALEEARLGGIIDGGGVQKTVQSLARKHLHGGERQLETQQISALARKLSPEIAKNIVLLGYYRDVGIVPLEIHATGPDVSALAAVSQRRACKKYFLSTLVPSLRKRLSSAENDACYFICHLTNHWVLVALVQVASSRCFVVLDSVNRSLSPSLLRYIDCLEGLLLS